MEGLGLSQFLSLLAERIAVGSKSLSKWQVHMADHKKMLLPRLDVETGINHSPHVVILGAGASRACCPTGDKNGRVLPVMSDFVRRLGIEDVIKESGHDPDGNFEATYSDIHRKNQDDILKKLDAAVRDYFGTLELPEQPTLYDYLILSLRPKDLIVTFNWDPLLPQAYRRWRHLGPVLPQLAFLHGNIDIAVDLDRKLVRFVADCQASDKGFRPSQLLYPVENKDYNSDPFIKGQWDFALEYLKGAYYVTVYGYSAPKTDVEARELLLNAWRDNPTQTLAEFDVVDIADKELVEKSWSDFIIRTHGSVANDFSWNLLRRHPRRTCEAFAFATLQQTPWREDPFPDAANLRDLEEWVKPLIAEEAEGRLSGTPHH